jgi:hypothetical protein
VGDWWSSVCSRGLRLALVAAAALAAAGCANGGTSTSSASNVSSTSTASPLAGLSGKQVLTMAVANLKTASSFTVSGTVTQAAGIIAVDLGFRPGHGCAGTISVSGKGGLTMVVIGTTAWVKPSDQYWKTVAGQQAQQAISALGGKYLKGPTSNPTIAGLSQFCDLNSFTAQLRQGNVVKGEAVTIDKRAFPLTDITSGETLYVTNSSHPLPIQLLNKTAGNKGTLIFGFGAPVSLTAPPASETVDAAKYGLLPARRLLALEQVPTEGGHPGAGR